MAQKIETTLTVRFVRIASVLALLGTSAVIATHVVAPQLFRSDQSIIVAAVGFPLATAAILITAMLTSVVKPIRKIVHAIRNLDLKTLDELSDNTTELGHIAFLLRQSFHQQREIAILNESLEQRVKERTAAATKAYESTIEGWAKALEFRDQETEGHSRRVTELSKLLGHSMNLSQDEQRFLRWGALLHDIGKMAIPDSILLKPGKLTDEERAEIEQHPLYAQQMLGGIEFLGEAIDVPLYHHEKWDGTGYPKGLAGRDIPKIARIFALADVWDALRSDRPYRRAWNEARTRAYLEEQAGHHFDPAVVKAYLAIPIEDIERIRGEAPQRAAA